MGDIYVYARMCVGMGKRGGQGWTVTLPRARGGQRGGLGVDNWGGWVDSDDKTLTIAARSD